MGWLGWFAGKSPYADRTARWVHEQIVDATRARNALALADAAAALDSGDGMAFGMVMGEFAGREQLRDDAVGALSKLVPDLPDDQCEIVFNAIATLKLPVEVEPRRALFYAAHHAKLQRTVARVEQAIQAADATALAEACARMLYAPTALGVPMPAHRPARVPLQAMALERLRDIVAGLDDDAAEELIALIRRYNLPIDVAARADAIAAHYRRERDDAVAAALRDEPRHEALEHALADGEPGAYHVYADWLQGQGHPRGELIALQLRAESAPSMQAAADAFLAAPPELYGPLYAVRRALTRRRGFVDRAKLERTDDDRLGVADVLAMLLAHPSGRMLSALAIGAVGAGDTTLDGVTATLARTPPPHLRELVLGDFDREAVEMSWYDVGEVGPLWPVLPHLRKLIVQGGSFDLGAIALPAAEHVELRTGGRARASLAAVAVASWPKLRFLDVWFGDPHYGAECTAADAEALLQRPMPALVHLGLKNCDFADELGALLARAPLAGQLVELDLSMGTLSDTGASALVAARGKLRRLAKLDVSESYLGADALAALRLAFPTVTIVAEDQGRITADPDDRVVSVGE